MAEAQKISDVILEQIIGKKPRKPQTYELRKRLNTPEDNEFCKNYEDRIAEWELKAEEVRKKQLQERQEDLKASEEFVLKESPVIRVELNDLIFDVKQLFKIQNKVDFKPINVYSGNNEPELLLYTLAYYFLKRDNFFKSPLLNSKISTPSFDKGLLIVGGYGVGKTSLMLAFSGAMNNFIKSIKKQKPSNLSQLTSDLEIRYSVSSDVVNKFNTALSKEEIAEIINPLLSRTQLYIDDILREQMGNNFGTRNIFLDVLTHRADRGYKTHLTLNYKEEVIKNESVFYDTEETLKLFKTKYDGRVYDRLFGLYNIIELTSKSFRR